VGQVWPEKMVAGNFKVRMFRHRESGREGTAYLIADRKKGIKRTVVAVLRPGGVREVRRKPGLFD